LQWVPFREANIMCKFNCPQCGEETPALHEGYCLQCCSDNQASLDSHNFQLDRWNSMNDSQRDAEIKNSYR
jgi:hypothetical protein